MTAPLAILAAFAVVLGFIGTPAWPWFQSFLEGHHAEFNLGGFSEPGVLPLMLSSSIIVLLGVGLGWALYGRRPIPSAEAPDVLSAAQPQTFTVLNNAYFVDRIYGATLIRFNTWWVHICAWFDRWVWNGVVQLISWTVIAFSWFDSLFDNYFINTGFDAGCSTVSGTGRLLARMQAGRVQGYLRAIGFALIALVIYLFWGARI